MRRKLVLELTQAEAWALWRLLSEGLHEDLLEEHWKPADRRVARRVAGKVASLGSADDSRQ